MTDHKPHDSKPDPDNSLPGRVAALEKQLNGLRVEIAQSLPEMCATVLRKQFGMTVQDPAGPHSLKPKAAKPEAAPDAPPCPDHPKATQTVNGCTVAGCLWPSTKTVAAPKLGGQQPAQESKQKDA